MTNSIQRRQLVFADLDDVIRDAVNLRSKGYTKAGNWDLAQVSGHLTKWLTYPLDGFPRSGCMVGAMLWLMRMTVGRSIKRKVLASGKIRAGGPTIPESVPAPGGDEEAAVTKLKEAIERFKSYSGELHPSPLFGPMQKEELARLHAIHCAHHLSFLIPKPM